MKKQSQVAQYLEPEASHARKAVLDAVARTTVDKERAKNIGMENAIKELESAREHVLRKSEKIVDFRIKAESKTLNESVLETAPFSIVAAKGFNTCQ